MMKSDMPTESKQGWRGRGSCRSLSTNNAFCMSSSSPSTNRTRNFAERVRSETVYRHAGRYCIWSAVVFIASLLFMVFTFSRSVDPRIRRRGR